MKVLFIYTEVSSEVGYSAGIGILSAILKRGGHQTRLIHISPELDYTLDLDRINNDISRLQPGLICLSVTTNQWYFARQVGKSIKKEFKIPIIVGGHHPTADPEKVIAEPWVDIVCRGEGDEVLPEVVHRIESGKSFDGIPNLLFRKNGKIVREPLLSWVKDLDSLPFEDHEVFDYSSIVETRSGWAEVIVTRGCPYRCSFCFNEPLFNQYSKDIQTFKGHVLRKKEMLRRRSVDATIKMLKELKIKYTNIKGFTFVDDVMAREGQWLDEFVVRYKNEIGLPYTCTSQALLFNERVASQLKESGCKVVKMGIEVGNESVRKNVLKKNISNELLMKVFSIAQRYGLKPQSFNMIGIPGESIEDMMETIHLNARIKPYIVWLSTFNPYPGSELYHECIRKGMIDESKWDQVGSFRGGSVFKDEFLPSLELKKIRVLFRWLLNANLDNPAAEVYKAQVDEFWSLSDDKWETGKVEKLFQERDLKIDLDLRRKDISHYVSKKYINIFWGREYGYDLS